MTAATSSESPLRDELLRALAETNEYLLNPFAPGLDAGGRLPGFPPDAVPFAALLVAHEAHHRGPIVMLARQLGHRLPEEVATGPWQRSLRLPEAAAER